jgi:hypothetical protein
MHARNIAVRNCRFVVITSSIGDYVSKTVGNKIPAILFCVESEQFQQSVSGLHTALMRDRHQVFAERLARDTLLELLFEGVVNEQQSAHGAVSGGAPAVYQRFAPP